MKLDKELLQHTFKNSWKSMLVLAGFWFMAWLGTPYTILMILVLALTIGTDLSGVLMGDLPRKPLRLFKNVAVVFIIFYAASILNYYLGGKGLLGLLIIGLVFGLFILVRRWELYMWWIRHIETQLYGKPRGKEKKKEVEK